MIKWTVETRKDNRTHLGFKAIVRPPDSRPSATVSLHQLAFSSRAEL